MDNNIFKDKKCIEWLHHWFVWAYSNTKHQGVSKSVAEDGQIINTNSELKSI